MKKAALILIPALAVLGWLGWMRTIPNNPPAHNDAPPVVWQGSPPTRTQTNAEEVFKRAFWRRPSAEDKILHAERHEWSDAEGLVRWQWFLCKRPLPEMPRGKHAEMLQFSRSTATLPI